MAFGDDEDLRNNPYTDKDHEVLDKMKKIQKKIPELNEEITFNFCTREIWNAQPARPDPPMRQLNHPVDNVRFTDTGTDECYTPHECFKVLQHLQQQHMEKENLADIKYNFMVGADGTIYEGRGWKNEADRPPQHSKLQGNCLDIAYIGNIDDQEMMDDENNEEFLKKLKAQKAMYDWVIHGQQGNNYVRNNFIVVNSFNENF